MEAPERGMEPDDDTDARRAADAAAAEAGGIGGRADDSEDPATRPLAESGQGEAEGFEQAEAELIEQAEHSTGGEPVSDRGRPEPDAERAPEGYRSAAYGEADEVEATEVVRDPETGADDPGEGPGIASER